ncbi:hypothetical protein [Natrinema longum]|uniref:Uncharacterized protein n=1 Tax=Natrinema longum TaxID=370324 RepID=A0A8A2UGK7_9EURY|nr:hypothetical protein [Natrinema longum]MBZ6495483.1 hypothetical protein [Natrinema longum]QSW86548.1 hypothetical protein J0X27_06955 [Natrinema longum]
MATDRADEDVDRADDVEVDVSYPVILAQVSLAGLLVCMSLGWLLLTTNAILDSQRTFTEFFWALPAIFGVAAVLLSVTTLSR